MLRAKKDYWFYSPSSGVLAERLSKFLNLIIKYHSTNDAGTKEFLVNAGQQKVKPEGEVTVGTIGEFAEVTKDDILLPTPTFSLTQRETYWELLSESPLVIGECAELRYVSFKTVLSVTQFVTLVKFKEETEDTWALEEAQNANADNVPTFSKFMRMMEERQKLLENKDFIRFNLSTRSGDVYPINLPFIGFRRNYMVIDNDCSNADTFNQVGAGFCGVAMPDGKENSYDNDNYYQLSRCKSALVITDYTPFFSKPFRGYDVLRPRIIINMALVQKRAQELEDDAYEPVGFEEIEDSINPFVPAFYFGRAIDGEFFGGAYPPEDYLVIGMSYAQLFVVGTYDLVGGA